MSDTVAARVLDAVGPAFRRAAGPLLAPVVDALTEPAQSVADLVDPGLRDWADGYDLDTTPDPRWLAQATGTSVPFGLTDPQVRDIVRDRPAWRRGTPRAMLAAAHAVYPSGLVTLVERDGSPWRTTIRIYGAEATPDDQARIVAAVAEHKPVGIDLHVELVTGASYTHLMAEAATYDALTALYPTYDVMRAHVPEEGTVP